MTPYFFGRQSQYYHFVNGAKECSNSLADSIKLHGFSDFNPLGIQSFFSFRYPILDLTMFENYHRETSDTELQKDFSFSYDTASIALDVAISKTKKLLLESILSKVGNARRIGIALSGGLDSSLVCAMCRYLFPEREIYAYSMGFEGDDEFIYATQVAKMYATKHFAYTLDANDYFGEESILPQLILQKAAPLHPNELPLAIAFQHAKSHGVEIMLCGADILFVSSFVNNKI